MLSGDTYSAVYPDPDDLFITSRVKILASGHYVIRDVVLQAARDLAYGRCEDLLVCQTETILAAERVDVRAPGV